MTFGTGTYKVAYYDANGTYITLDNSIAVSGDGIFQSSLYFPNYGEASRGGYWRAVAYEQTGTDAEPYDSNDGDIIANVSLYVAASAIPELPIILSSVGVAGLCGVVYLWMRRKRLKHAKVASR